MARFRIKKISRGHVQHEGQPARGTVLRSDAKMARRARRGEVSFCHNCKQQLHGERERMVHQDLGHRIREGG